MRRLSIVLLPLLLIACSQQANHASEPQIVRETTREPLVFFCPRDNCSQQFSKLAENASQLDCAFFDLDLGGIITTLAEKDARLVIDNANEKEVKDTNLDYHVDNSNQLSHNKFCVMDNNIVWTGSLNPTINGDTKNNNNVIVLFSKYLTENYKAEFDELWTGNFGRGSTVQYPVVYLNEHRVENYFCPEDDCKGHVMKALQHAEHSIYFMTFSFTDNDIADMLIAKASQGTEVRGVMEKQRINMQYNRFKYLSENGVEVVPDSNKYFMHHKVFIIDNSTVITGSYNPTKSGNERNDENIVIVHDINVAQRYLDEFDRLSY